jgi:hypothetical protein
VLDAGLWLLAALLMAATAAVIMAQRSSAKGERIAQAVATGAVDAATGPTVRATGELPYFGFNELRWATSWQYGEGPDPDLAMRGAVDTAAAAGANTSRLPVPWFDVVDAAGGWDEAAWDRYRDAYEQMVSRGLKPVIVLYAAPSELGQGDPAWAPRECPAVLESPADPAANADWQAYVVRASNEFDQALALQVWNEPNSRDFWGGPNCPPDPGRYVELVALARQALAGPGSEHPDRMLVSAGLNPATAPGSIEWRQYLQATISAGLLGYAQAAGVHVYPLRGDCGRGLDSAAAVAQGAERQLAEAAAIVPEPTPLWVTEFGVSSAAGMTTDCRALSELDQARALAGVYDGLAASPRVELAIAHQLVDESTSYPEQLPNRFGVTRDGPEFLRPKPAYWCLASRRGVAVDPALVCE